PEKFVLPVILAWVVAAAFGFDAVLFGRRGENAGVKRMLLVVSGLAAATALGAIAWGSRGPRAWVDLGVAPSVAREMTGTLVSDALLVAAWAGAAACLVHLLPRRRRLVGTLLVILAAADLVVAGRTLLPTSPVPREETP